MVSQLRYLTLAYYLWILCLIWLRYCVWSLHDYTNKKKTFDDNDSNTAKEKQKNPWSLFFTALISKNLSFSGFLFALLPLQMKNCLFLCLHNSCMPFNKVVWPFPCEWVNLVIFIFSLTWTQSGAFVTITRRQLLDWRVFGLLFYKRKRTNHWPKIEYHAKYIKESLISYTRKPEVQVVKQK